MNNDKSKTTKAEYFFFLGVFFLISLLMYNIFQPILGPIIFGGIIAGSALPLFRYLKDKFKWTDHVASIVTSLIITLAILTPSIFLSIQLSQEALGFYDGIKQFIEGDRLQKFLASDNILISTIKKIIDIAGVELDWNFIKSKILGVGQNISGSVLKAFNQVLGNIFQFLFDFSMAILTVYALLAQGNNLKKYIFKLSPLSDDDEQTLLNTFNQMNYVSLVCNGVGGIIQGGVAGLLFLVLGVKSPFMWTAIMIVLAFIPLLGISIITIPGALIFIFSGEVISGVILLAVSLSIAFWTENVFKPKFIGDRIRINSIFVLFTIVGGMSVYGISGVFYGPLIGILFLTIVTIYQQKYS